MMVFTFLYEKINCKLTLHIIEKITEPQSQPHTEEDILIGFGFEMFAVFHDVTEEYQRCSTLTIDQSWQHSPTIRFMLHTTERCNQLYETRNRSLARREHNHLGPQSSAAVSQTLVKRWENIEQRIAWPRCVAGKWANVLYTALLFYITCIL